LNERRYFLLCFDSRIYTIDDFRLSGIVVGSGRMPPRIRLAVNDWFILFDVATASFVGHGFVQSPAITNHSVDAGRFEMHFKGSVARKKNRPLGLQDKCLSFLREPNSKRLTGWGCRATTRLTMREFDRFFECWWGVSSFSESLP